jgi:hypothetical protein
VTSVFPWVVSSKAFFNSILAHFKSHQLLQKIAPCDNLVLSHSHHIFILPQFGRYTSQQAHVLFIISSSFFSLGLISTTFPCLPAHNVSLPLSQSRHCLSSQLSVLAAKEKCPSPKNFSSPSLLRLTRLPLLSFPVSSLVPLFFSIFSSPFLYYPYSQYPSLFLFPCSLFFFSLFYFGRYLLKDKSIKMLEVFLSFSLSLISFHFLQCVSSKHQTMPAVHEINKK